MRKVLVLIFCLALLFTSVLTVSAAESTYSTTTWFFVQRFGAHMDEEGKVASQPTSFFTPKLYETYLTDEERATDYSVVYKEGSVSSDDVIRDVDPKPSDAQILEKIKNLYGDDGHILASNGKAVKWEKFTTDNYEMRWYVLKAEKEGYIYVWHVDGVVVEKDTQKPIEIVDPSDPGYTPPVYEDEDQDHGEAFEYTSNFAYIYGYSDNTMAADNNLRRSEVSAMVHRLVKQNNKLGGFMYSASNPPAFDDIEGEWFRSGIEFINHKGAFTGGGSVYPYVDVTRGETFKIICLGLGFSENTGLSYEDYAAILQKAGYIQGDENGDLNICKLITRAEFCTIYNRIIGRDKAKLVTADGVEITAETYGFNDLKESKWYYETMLRATSAYDDDGYVDIELRNQRNVLDDYQ